MIVSAHDYYAPLDDALRPDIEHAGFKSYALFTRRYAAFIYPAQRMTPATMFARTLMLCRCRCLRAAILHCVMR